MAEQSKMEEMESRIITLETMVAYQEKNISDLDAVIQEQYALIERLQQQLIQLQESITEGALVGEHSLREDKPPHY